MFSLLTIAISLGVALGAYGTVVRILGRRLAGKGGEFWGPLLLRSRRPARLALIIFAFSWAARAAPLPVESARLTQHGLLIGFIVLCGWVATMALDVGSALYMRRYRLDVEDNLLARKHLTQVKIFRRATTILAILITAAFALMTIPGVRQLGVSLLAAGGAAGIIVGLALQPVLSNLMAGFQIALSQPIRIDDAVVVEGEWGVVEEITSAFVVIRIWDKRRLVVPLKYFLENPFQNWTRTTADLIGVVLLYLDYSTPLGPLRAKLREVAERSPLWDRNVIALQVTDVRERTMEVRCLVGARNSGQTFDLRCEVREKLIEFLQAEHPHALPRQRLELQPDQGGRWPPPSRSVGSGAPDPPAAEAGARRA